MRYRLEQKKCRLVNCSLPPITGQVLGCLLCSTKAGILKKGELLLHKPVFLLTNLKSMGEGTRPLRVAIIDDS